MKYMRRTAGYTRTDYKTNTQIAKELKITPVLDIILEYNRNWIQHVNRMPRSRLSRIMKHYSPTGRRNHGRLLKRILDTWDRNGSTSGPNSMTDIWWWSSSLSWSIQNNSLAASIKPKNYIITFPISLETWLSSFWYQWHYQDYIDIWEILGSLAYVSHPPSMAIALPLFLRG